MYMYIYIYIYIYINTTDYPSGLIQKNLVCGTRVEKGCTSNLVCGSVESKRVVQTILSAVQTQPPTHHKNFVSDSTWFQPKPFKRSAFLFRRDVLLLTNPWCTVGVTITVETKTHRVFLRCASVSGLNSIVTKDTDLLYFQKCVKARGVPHLYRSFSTKESIIGDSFAKNDLQLKASNESSPSCTRC